MTDPSSDRSLRVFLCHAQGDKPAVRELYRRLVADGIDAWLDEESLLPGQDWQLEIPQAVRTSDAVIVCLSKGSINKAGYVQKEIKFALDVADAQPQGAIFLIPLRLEDCEVPERLRRWQWVNLFSGHGYARLLKALRTRASSLGVVLPATAPSASTSPEGSSSAATITNISGGVDIGAEQVQVEHDAVGRDKVIQAHTYIEQAVLMQATPTLPFKVTAHASHQGAVQRWADIEFVRIPAGGFLMGSLADNRFADENEKPQHTVELPYAYWIARSPLTYRQFGAFIDATKAEIDLATNWPNLLDHPVVNVTWHEASAYCQWLSQQLPEELHDLIARLPTEAEWEKAARGIYGYEWPWGNEWDATRCNSTESGRGATTPVGAYSPQGASPYGAVDMVGNIWEWCHSLDRPYPYVTDDGRESEVSVELRVVRGGAYQDSFAGTRCAYRSAFLPHRRHETIGFRVVLAPRLV